jgi:uroporphyrin-3 C-methyltransferase
MTDKALPTDSTEQPQSEPPEVADAETTVAQTPEKAASPKTRDAAGAGHGDTSGSDGNGGRGVAVIALVVALAAAGATAWQWFDGRAQMRGTQNELAKRLAEEGAVVREVRSLSKEAQETAAATQAKVGVLAEKFVEFESQQAALEALYQELARSRDEWVLAEVDQLVSLAAQQLEVAGNVSGATLALTHAEARLARAERPQYQALRKALISDLDKLRGQSATDLPGISARLDSVISAADRWPLAFQMRASSMDAVTAPDAGKAPDVAASVAAPDGAEAPLSDNPALAWLQSRWRELSAGDAWRAVLGDVWGEIRGLVRIERFDRLEPVLLPPSQVFFLRENVKLRLLNARLSLFIRDATTFRSELAQTRAAIERHFDQQNTDVQSALSTLTRLDSAEVSVAIPDINTTLAALRTVKLGQERAEPKGVQSQGAR